MARVPEDTFLPEHYWSVGSRGLPGREQGQHSEIGIVKRILNFFKRWLYKAGAIQRGQADTGRPGAIRPGGHATAHMHDVWAMRQSVRDLFKPVDTESAAFKLIPEKVSSRTRTGSRWWYTVESMEKIEADRGRTATCHDDWCKTVA